MIGSRQIGYAPVTIRGGCAGGFGIGAVTSRGGRAGGLASAGRLGAMLRLGQVVAAVSGGHFDQEPITSSDLLAAERARRTAWRALAPRGDALLAKDVGGVPSSRPSATHWTTAT